MATGTRLYDEISTVYAATYGEPLVAGWEWVEPILSTCEVSVACGADLSAEDFMGDAEHGAVIERVCEVIAVTTYGVKQSEFLRQQTAGHRAIEATS